MLPGGFGASAAIGLDFASAGPEEGDASGSVDAAGPAPGDVAGACEEGGSGGGEDPEAFAAGSALRSSAAGVASVAPDVAFDLANTAASVVSMGLES